MLSMLYSTLRQITELERAHFFLRREASSTDALPTLWEKVALYGGQNDSSLSKQCVAENSAEAASEEIHETEAPRQRRCLPSGHLEVDAEVRGKLIVHRKLCSEARAVLNDHDDHLERHESLRYPFATNQTLHRKSWSPNLGWVYQRRFSELKLVCMLSPRFAERIFILLHYRKLGC